MSLLNVTTGKLEVVQLQSKELEVVQLQFKELEDGQIPPYAMISYAWESSEVTITNFQSSHFKRQIRLLNVRTLEVEQFFGCRIPPYTILSHTWGTEEVSSADIQSSDFKNKKGYEKIRYACKQTIEDGWDYTWIDTCCIDKTSSAELSETINSMFQWYSDAEVCYVYLADVHESQDPGLQEQEDSGSSIQVEGSLAFSDMHFGNRSRGYTSSGPRETFFGRSRWFTRGWTLQELVAPSEVKFYNANWKYLGGKRELAQTLQQITGIDYFILKLRNSLLLRRALDETCAARKMSWASKRETTRSEDVAYCLLGLFGESLLK